jgi:hypothetical protein
MTDAMDLETAIATIQRASKAAGGGPLVWGPSAGPRAVTPGRLVVAPGQTISSDWGNITHDQTCLAFANAGDRDNQWPAPNDGALCYLADTKTVWRRVAGVWRGAPMGLQAYNGTHNGADIVNATAVVVTAPFALVGGRKYLIEAYGTGSIISAVSATCYWQLDDLASSIGATRYTQNSAPVGGAVGNSLTAVASPAANLAATFRLVGYSAGATTGMRLAANTCHISVTDIG